jgi:hypothetical protein
MTHWREVWSNPVVSCRVYGVPTGVKGRGDMPVATPTSRDPTALARLDEQLPRYVS